MNRLLKSVLVVTGLLLSVTAMAHPGHGTFSGHELWHYITSPMHVGIVMGGMVILFAGYKFLRSSKSTSKK